MTRYQIVDRATGAPLTSAQFDFMTLAVLYAERLGLTNYEVVPV